MRRIGAPVLTLLAAAACTNPPAPPLEPLATDDVQRPTSVQSVAFEATAFDMPADWQAGAAWQVVVHPDGRVLAGGQSGLYALGDTIELIDPTPVVGLLAHDELGFVVFTDAGTLIYDEALYPSALDDMLAGLTVHGVAQRGPELWLLTDAELYALVGESLSSYPDLLSVDALYTHDDASFLVAQSGADTTLLRDDAGSLTAQSLDDELANISLAAPGPHDRIFAVTAPDGGLFERVPVEGGVRWLPVALSDDATDLGALGIDTVLADPIAGSLWLTQGTHLQRIDAGGAVSTITWPSAIPAAGRLVATADGAVWLANDAQLVRVGPSSPPPSYQQHIVPFYQDNCAKCHEAGGEVATVTRFSDFDGFTAIIDTIIEQVESGLMPAGDQELLGDPELPRKWRDGGLRP